MKKNIFITLILSLILGWNSFSSAATDVINLHTDSAYIMSVQNRPMQLKVSNENVIKAEVVTDLYTPESQIVIRSFEEGISYVTFKIKGTMQTIKVLVDDKAPVDKNLTEIDRVKESDNR